MRIDENLSDDPHTKIATLSNGIKLIVREIPNEPIANMLVLVGGGADDEILGGYTSGMAHFFEHIPFRGSHNLNSEPYIAKREIENIGGIIGAFTSRDSTCYWADFSPKEISKAIEAMSNLVCRPDFDGSEFKIERDIIHLEWLEYYVNTDANQHWRLFHTAFGKPSGVYPVIGTEEAILSVKPDDLRAFHKNTYKNENTIIAIEGSVGIDLIAAQLEREFNLSAGSKEKIGKRAYSGGIDLFPHEGKEVRVNIGNYCKGQEDHQVRAAYMVMTDLLNKGTESALFRELRDIRGLTYGVQCQNYFSDDLLSTSFITFPKNARSCIDIIGRELNRLKFCVDSEALARLKKLKFMQYLEYMKKQKYGAYNLANYFFYEKRIPERGHSSLKYQSVTHDEIVEAARNMLQYPPTIVAAGNVSKLPGYKIICEMFRRELPKKPIAKKKTTSPPSPTGP